MVVRKVDICPFEEWITVSIEGKEKTIDLLDTNISYVKKFYLGYYENEMFINMKTRKISKNAFEV